MLQSLTRRYPEPRSEHNPTALKHIYAVSQLNKNRLLKHEPQHLDYFKNEVQAIRKKYKIHNAILKKIHSQQFDSLDPEELNTLSYISHNTRNKSLQRLINRLSSLQNTSFNDLNKQQRTSLSNLPNNGRLLSQLSESFQRTISQSLASLYNRTTSKMEQLRSLINFVINFNEKQKSQNTKRADTTTNITHEGIKIHLSFRRCLNFIDINEHIGIWPNLKNNTSYPTMHFVINNLSIGEM